MLSFPDFDKKRIVVVFAIESQKFAIQNDNLIVKDSEDKVILQDTCYRILSLWIVGNCSITSVLLKKSKKHGFPIFHLGGNFRMIGYWNSATEGNFLLRYRQYLYSNKDIAKLLVVNKISNQLKLLKNIRIKGLSEKEAIVQLETYKEKIQSTHEWKEILGTEGVASKVFFSAYFKNTNWEGRRPRSKINAMNVLMDIGYTFLFYWIENMLTLYGFDLYKGVYHQNFYQRKSLVCDIIEPFRCIIDRQLRNSYNLGQIKDDDFDIVRNQYMLKPDKAKEYTRWLLLSILEHKDAIFYYCRDYYRAFIREKPITDYPFFDIIDNKN
ncbi:type V CRISPR-associated endonuclease Cas1 [Daejeonella sp.]|uniref:type V CRISPR-associated endonuclease Cas1 n=1 Tax=Daejeonella sp. TaxID=2805397 RepID=UPI0025C242F5|nr:type V CRISPR-associated endonuclease Cas1 [Daejeonella sp.]